LKIVPSAIKDNVLSCQYFTNGNSFIVRSNDQPNIPISTIFIDISYNTLKISEILLYQEIKWVISHKFPNKILLHKFLSDRFLVVLTGNSIFIFDIKLTAQMPTNDIDVLLRYRIHNKSFNKSVTPPQDSSKVIALEWEWTNESSLRFCINDQCLWFADTTKKGNSILKVTHHPFKKEEYPEILKDKTLISIKASPSSNDAIILVARGYNEECYIADFYYGFCNQKLHLISSFRRPGGVVIPDEDYDLIVKENKVHMVFQGHTTVLSDKLETLETIENSKHLVRQMLLLGKTEKNEGEGGLHLMISNKLCCRCSVSVVKTGWYTEGHGDGWSQMESKAIVKFYAYKEDNHDWKQTPEKIELFKKWEEEDSSGSNEGAHDIKFESNRCCIFGHKDKMRYFYDFNTLTYIIAV